MFNWIARNSKETESEQVTTILSVAYVIYAIQLNSQYHNSIEYKFSEPNFFLMLYVFVQPGQGWLLHAEYPEKVKKRMKRRPRG